MKLEEIMNLKGKALAAKAAELSISGRSKMSADELRNAILKEIAQREEDMLEAKQMVNRAAGADVFPEATQMTKEEFDAYVVEDEKRVADAHRIFGPLLKDMKHLTTVQRCVNYANALRGALPTKAVKLTPKQMRRVKHKANKHGEDFRTIDNLPEDDKGYALLARTPQGHGIFVKAGA